MKFFDEQTCGKASNCRILTAVAVVDFTMQQKVHDNDTSYELFCAPFEVKTSTKTC